MTLYCRCGHSEKRHPEPALACQTCACKRLDLNARSKRASRRDEERIIRKAVSKVVKTGLAEGNSDAYQKSIAALGQVKRDALLARLKRNP